jgi:hypothetical protein
MVASCRLVYALGVLKVLALLGLAASTMLVLGVEARVEIHLPANQTEPLDGRLLLLISDNNLKEPRFQVTDAVNTQIAFGVDADGWRAGKAITFDQSVFGYPLKSLRDLPAGEYYVQALLHKYETFKRSDGHVVKLPMDRGEGQQWNQAPGNLFSKPVKVRLDQETVSVQLDSVIPPIVPPTDTKYVKHIRIQSERLTKFWGRPMHLGAVVLLPEGWDTHPNAKYPLALFHGHFASTIEDFRVEPPDEKLEPDFNDRFKIKGYNRTVQKEAHEF